MNRALEILASITTLAGIYLGSTTQAGSALYVVSSFFWFAMMFRMQMWGLAPLNVAGAFLNVLNVYRAWF